MPNLYKQYLRLLNKWPVDELKSRDLGQHLRNEIKDVFKKGEYTTIENKEQCQRYYESLNRIALNYYSEKYPCKFKSTATGLTSEICTLALSPEVQKLLGEKKLGFFKKNKQKLKNTVSKLLQPKEKLKKALEE